MHACDAAHPRRFGADADQRLAVVARVVALQHLAHPHLHLQVQVDGHGDAAEIRCHVRHELHRVPEVTGDFALVQMADQRVRHEVVAQ
jgi:hypothetical protein